MVRPGSATMLQKLLQPFSRPGPRTSVVVSSEKGSERSEPKLSLAEQQCEIVETFLRRDAHGGFGVFFESGGRGVVRKISAMWDSRVADGRGVLKPGDVVVRVGGFPTATAEDVVRAMRDAETMVALTARGPRRLVLRLEAPHHTGKHMCT